MCKEYAPYFPVSRIIGRSGSGDSFGHVKDAVGDNIQEIISLGGGLVWNDAAICGWRMGLKILVRD